MKSYKLNILAVIVAPLMILALASTGALAETPIFKNYQVAVIQPFEVPLNVASPDSAGRELADEIVYQIRRYGAKFNLFDMVIMEDAQKIPAGKKVLFVKGTVTVYSPKGTCAVRCQFVDKASGQVLHETEAKGLTFRVANYLARIIYSYKVGEK